MTRVEALDPATLDVEQRRVHDEIAGSRGGAARGPFGIWLRNPGLADAANRLGGQLRLQGKLPRGLFELSVLLIARNWSAQYEWAVHEQTALDHGISRSIVEAVRNGTTPAFADEAERIVHDVTTELLTARALSGPTYERALDRFGLDLVIELVAAIGFYTMVAVTLVAFDVAAPGGIRPLAPL